jgi:small-conductance mechanosensitive channel
MGNFTAGVLLIYTRSFKVGDFVRIGDAHGQVTERTLLVTRLASMKSENVTIPNSRVLGSDVINYSAMPGKDGILVHLSVGLGYDLDWREAHRLMKNAALETTHIAKNPVPFVLQHSLDDFSVTYEINAYTQRSDILPGIRSELLANILDAFNTAEVEILSPRYTAVREGDEKAIPERSG